MEALGDNAFDFFLDGLLKQLCHVVSTGGSVDEDGLNFMLSVVKGIVNTQEAIREADRCHSVADLSAGFWVALLNASYNIAFSWRYNLARIFPVLLCAGCDRAAIALRHPGESPEREGSFGRIDAKGSALLNGVLVLTAIIFVSTALMVRVLFC